MIRTKLLACETLKDEITWVMEKEHLEIPIIWIESGLHNFPGKLHSRLQEAIDQETDCDRLILLFGLCGNATKGLMSSRVEMIIPKADDCISLLFGSDQARRKFAEEYAAYFLTEGWMRGERNLWVEYQYSVEKYGEETARQIAKIMYGHYRTLALLDTEAGSAKALMEETQRIEEELHLKRVPVRGTLSYIRELIAGPWPEERYYVLPPGTPA